MVSDIVTRVFIDESSREYHISWINSGDITYPVHLTNNEVHESENLGV